MIPKSEIENYLKSLNPNDHLEIIMGSELLNNTKEEIQRISLYLCPMLCIEKNGGQSTMYIHLYKNPNKYRSSYEYPYPLGDCVLYWSQVI